MKAGFSVGAGLAGVRDRRRGGGYLGMGMGVEGVEKFRLSGGFEGREEKRLGLTESLAIINNRPYGARWCQFQFSVAKWMASVSTLSMKEDDNFFCINPQSFQNVQNFFTRTDRPKARDIRDSQA